MTCCTFTALGVAREMKKNLPVVVKLILNVRQTRRTLAMRLRRTISLIAATPQDFIRNDGATALVAVNGLI